MRDKVHRLRDLGHDLKDSLIATVIIISLPESYALLRQHLYMKDETTLTTDFVIKQILMDEKSREGASHVALMGHNKGKRPIYQASSQSNDHEGKKRDVKCFYCKRIGHIKSECRKMNVMNRDTRTFLFSVVSIFTFLFLEWTYIIGEVTWEVT